MRCDMSGTALKNPSELPARLGLERPERVLLVDAPSALADLLRASRPKKSETLQVEALALATVKEPFDAILLWREDRVGSRSVMEQTGKRVAPGGRSRTTRGRAPPARAKDPEARTPAWPGPYRFTSLAVRSLPRREPPP